MKVITNFTSKGRMCFDVAFVEERTMNMGEIRIVHIKCFNAEQLFTNVKKVMIEHQNEIYILRITKQNKLILTK